MEADVPIYHDMGITVILVLSRLCITASCKEPILLEQDAAAVLPTTLRGTSVSKICNLSDIILPSNRLRPLSNRAWEKCLSKP